VLAFAKLMMRPSLSQIMGEPSAKHGRMSPPSVGERKGTIRFLQSAEPPSDAERPSDISACGNSVNIRGVRWCARVTHTGGHLGVYLVMQEEQSVECRCSFTIRLLSTDASRGIRSVVRTHDFVSPMRANGGECGDAEFVSWATLVDPANGYVVDGKFTVEIDLRPDEPTVADDRAKWSHHKTATFEHLLFTDMCVGMVLSGDECIPCNKAIVCRHSNVSRIDPQGLSQAICRSSTAP
jgi:hypothetical protein